MKTVILKPLPEETVVINEVSEEKFYAVTRKGEKMPVTCAGYKSYFITLAENEFTNGNGHDFNSLYSLKDFLKECIDIGFKVYEFDKIKDMYKFLSE